MDKKTGIQAIERHEAGLRLVKKGIYAKYEYERNETTTLITAIKVENRELFSHTLSLTRTEKDYTKFMKKIVCKLPEKNKVIVLSD